jgi:signal peptidase I
VAGTIIAALIVLRVFVYEPFRVPSDSMYPTIPRGSFLIVHKLGFGNVGWSYRFKREPTAEVSRGDIVVSYVGDDGTKYVQRVVGLPGDHVILEGRQLTINAIPVPVSLAPGPLTEKRSFRLQLATEIIDGREVSIAWIPDRPSRNFDAVVPEGHYFMLGDNRDNARDSRFAEVGFIEKRRLVGRVAKVWTPPQPRAD